MKLIKNHKGEFFIIINTIFWGISPVILRGSEGVIPPLFFAGISNFLGGLFYLFLTFKNKETHNLFNKKLLHYQFVAVILFAAFWYFFILAGQKTAPGNLSILFLSSVLFSFILFGSLKLEKITLKRILGAIFILIGAITVIVNTENMEDLISWDILVLLSAFLIVCANFFEQKIVRKSTVNIAMSFAIFTGILLLFISFFLENITWDLLTKPQVIFYIIIYTLIVTILNNFLWLEGIRRIDLSKALSLDGLSPIFTMIFAFIFLGNIPTFYQIIGFILVFPGVILVVKKRRKFTGIVEKGRGVGKKIGYPTLNINSGKMPEFQGIFAGWVEFLPNVKNTQKKRYKAAIFLGKAKTFNIEKKTFEAYLLDFNKNVKPGEKVKVLIGPKIRKNKKFKKVKTLIKAIENDCKEVRKLT